MDSHFINDLIIRQAKGIATLAETEALLHYYADPEYAEEVKAAIEEYWNKASFEQFLNKEQSEHLYASILRKIKRPSRKFMVTRRSWWMAASFILAVGLGAYLISDISILKNQHTAVVELTDISAPTTSNAVILLENGSKKELKQQETIIIPPKPASSKTDNSLNTIFNPRGSRPVAVVLPDGTRLWLSAESSLKYPLEFAADERRVQVSGEAYFEVAHQKNRPFIVDNGTTEVKVLGTHFNINTFNEKTLVTLLEGVIQVSTKQDSGIVKPGHSAIIDKGLNIVKSDTASIMAWKSNLFSFDQMPLRNIMEEVGRWYNVDVVYESTIQKITLSGSIDRKINVSRVLEMLQLTSGLHFKIAGRKIIVKSK